jgi:hypothetical protein
MVNLKQELNWIDYFGPAVVFAMYAAIVFVICITCIMWCCIEEGDDVTVLQKVRLLFYYFLLFFIVAHWTQEKV